MNQIMLPVFNQLGPYIDRWMAMQRNNYRNLYKKKILEFQKKVILVHKIVCLFFSKLHFGCKKYCSCNNHNDNNA